jgi:hypothetical protein
MLIILAQFDCHNLEFDHMCKCLVGNHLRGSHNFADQINFKLVEPRTSISCHISP